MKGRYLDNIFVERLWRIKYEEVYLAYQTVAEARTGINAYLAGRGLTRLWATGPQQRCTNMASDEEAGRHRAW